MNSASLARSPRLRRTLDALERAGGRWVTTRWLVRHARICAVNSVVAELRDNGCVIACRQRYTDGVRRWAYRLESAPEGWRARGAARAGTEERADV